MKPESLQGLLSLLSVTIQKEKKKSKIQPDYQIEQNNRIPLLLFFGEILTLVSSLESRFRS